MRNPFSLALLLSFGCGSTAKWEGVWFVEAPVMDASACVTTGDENFDNADMPVPEEPVGPWTYLGESTLSSSAFFVEVMAGKGDEVFVVVGDDVFPGTADSKLLQVQWTGSRDDWSSQEHERGYFYSRADLSETLEKLTFVDPKAGQATGTLQITSSSTTEWYESDRWRLEDTGFAYSNMQQSSAILVGDQPSNLQDSLQCADDDCHLRIQTDCDGQVDLTASFAGKFSDGLVSGIEDAGQDAGTGAITTF